MLRMKKLLPLILTVSLPIAVLAGCGTANKNASAGNNASSGSNSQSSGSSPAQPTEFSFYFTGSQNVKELWDTLIPMFEKQTPDVKVKPVYVPSGTGAQSSYDRILAAKQAGKGSGGIDLFSDDLSTITKGQKDDLWETLSTGAIPNLDKMDPQTMKDVSNLAIPYRSSAVILAYNGDKVKTAPNTLDELYDWIRQHPGKFAYNDPSTGGSGDSFVQTAIYKFLPPESIHNTDPSIEKDWDKGFSLLKELGPYVYGKGIYPKKNQGTLDLLISGEVDMIPAWSDMALEQIDKGQLPKSTKLKQLNPGFNGGPAYLIVPKLSDKKEAVKKFLNFVLTPEAQSVIVEKMHGFPGIQLSSMPANVQEAFKGVSSGFRSFNIGDLSKDMYQRWQSEIAVK
ncbi:extracellular solute-binding protein [Paenibacillus filicis]|uniref:Extracellular solute-binding protein n=1 Tax=Paenibacillus gyeongsangnamensis TaxID=3388067 RepID=A0ABT4QI39_9BACL|nr:extracellular solute-binding protein [Paenibacillus filicis]MCZ8516442.1 extracellular solute-binding protein [Paenibacillus filicis]